jgi:hypothetical protein
MATHPVLVKQLQEPLMSVLEQTLASHRYALGLDQDNADTLFNTAQVLTSLAEEVAKDDSLSAASAVTYLEEALGLLQRCLALQEFRYTESQERAAEAREARQVLEEAGGQDESMDELSSTGQDSEDGLEDERWASIIEPVTKDTLIDTGLAQLSALTTLCGILGSSPQAPNVPSLAWIEEYSSTLLSVRLPSLVEGSERSVEVGIARVVFITAILEAGYRKGQIEAQTYWQETDAAFATLPISTSFDASMAQAASLYTFNIALSESESAPTASINLASLRWKALATPLSNLATASKLPDLAAEDVSRTHKLRGDASLYQYRLSKAPVAYPPAIKHAAALLKNAEVFYRNASKLTYDEKERDKSRLHEAIVILLAGNAQAGRGIIETIATNRGDQWLRERIDEVLTNDLLSGDDLQDIGLHQ